MSESELEARSLYVEQFGHGFIVADYSGTRKDRTGQTPEAVYAGARHEWVRQTISVGQPFPTREAAIAWAGDLESSR